MTVNGRIVLYQPEIPPNTGNIGRLALAAGFELHLIEPLGFSLDEKQLRRAGLDYWKHVSLFRWPSFDALLEQCRPPLMWAASRFAARSYTQPAYKRGDWFLFGRETAGLPDSLHLMYAESLIKIPMYDDRVRSLNLSNACSIIVYEALRQFDIQ